jgi:hypothetical protein
MCLADPVEHATGAATNPHELISIDENGAAGHLQAGHGDSEHTDFLPAEGSSDCSTGVPEDLTATRTTVRRLRE